MTFHADIASIQQGVSDRASAGGARPDGGQTTPVREGRRMFDTLAAQFEAQIGPSVICLPMSGSALDTAQEPPP